MKDNKCSCRYEAGVLGLVGIGCPVHDGDNPQECKHFFNKGKAVCYECNPQDNKDWKKDIFTLLDSMDMGTGETEKDKIKQLISKLLEEERENKTAMGVSQWLHHGKKYGYDDYFLEAERKSIRGKVLDLTAGRTDEEAITRLNDWLNEK